MESVTKGIIATSGTRMYADFSSKGSVSTARSVYSCILKELLLQKTKRGRRIKTRTKTVPPQKTRKGVRRTKSRKRRRKKKRAMGVPIEPPIPRKSLMIGITQLHLHYKIPSPLNPFTSRGPAIYDRSLDKLEMPRETVGQETIVLC